jgi:hypothetical protein
MKEKKILSMAVIIILIVFFALAWNIGANRQSESAAHYDGRSLTIGVIGEIPQIWEKQIKFTQLQSADLENVNIADQYDAIFVIEDKLPVGTEAKYTAFSKNYELPFFFGSFEHSAKDWTYAAGFIYKENRYLSWTFGLPENIENEKNIKDIYSKIFKTISENTFPKRLV